MLSSHSKWRLHIHSPHSSQVFLRDPSDTVPLWSLLYLKSLTVSHSRPYCSAYCWLTHTIPISNISWSVDNDRPLYSVWTLSFLTSCSLVRFEWGTHFPTPKDIVRFGSEFSVLDVGPTVCGGIWYRAHSGVCWISSDQGCQNTGAEAEELVWIWEESVPLPT